MRWFAVFDVGLLWISDRGIHFKNEVVRRLKAKNHLAEANCPWSTGNIESACRQLFRAFRAVLSELEMYAEEWPKVVDLVEIVLNNSLSTRLNTRTFMQIFTERAEMTPMASMLKFNVAVNAPLDFIKAHKLVEFEELSKTMTKIHAQVAKNDRLDLKAANT
jgi:hypothetical protein